MSETISELSEATELKSQNFCQVLQNRIDSYRLFSRFYLRPLSEEEIETLANMKLEDAAKDFNEGSLLYKGFNDMGRGLHRRHTGTKRLLSTDFTMCFDGLSAFHDERAVPYASLFVGAKKGKDAELFQEPRRLVKQAYAREGIEVDADLHLPDDHLSFELSFMADLSQKTIDAYEQGDMSEALRLLNASEDFLNKHILNWFPLLFDLATKIVDTRFYRGVLRSTYGYLQLDGDIISELRDELAL